jgi:hypothetical protein
MPFLHHSSMQVNVYKKAAKLFQDNQNDDISAIALIICHVYSKTYEQVNNMHPTTFTKYVVKIQNKIKALSKRPFYRKQILLTDAKKITFGQFVDLMHFYPQGEIEAIQLIAATILKKRTEVFKDAARLEKINVNRLLSDYNKFNTSFKNLIDSYKGLFEVQDEEEEPVERRPMTNNFMQKYGWIYSATELMKLTGKQLNETFDLNIVEALNYLSYLKAHANYMKELNK